MALRSMWSGALTIFPPIKSHVVIVKGSEPYRGKEPLKDVCACHHKPFTRETVCEGGHKRLTDLMRKKGETENTTEAVKAVETAKDEYLVIDDATVEQIAEAGTSNAIKLAAVVDAATVPMQRTSGLYYLMPNKSVKGEDGGAIALLYALLERTGKVAIAKWSPRGREQLIVIQPVDNVLSVSVLLYESEIKTPDERCILNHAAVSDAEVELAKQLAGELPSEFDFRLATDCAVAVRQEAIEAARAGEPIPTRDPDTSEESTPDLMAALQAATQKLTASKSESPVASSNGALAGATH